jgi:hypothetical protein
VIVAQASDAISAKAAYVAAAKAAHVAAAKAAHMASAKSATHVATTSTSATASLCTRGKKAPGKQRACQNHHRSSSHDILHLVGRACRHRPFSEVVLRKAISNVAMHGRWECLSVVSTKISFNQTELMRRGRMLAGSLAIGR